jgi:3,4-dihydroxy 2-butanone 4-phosphate synthase/GTP cyclohydrolase II
MNAAISSGGVEVLRRISKRVEGAAATGEFVVPRREVVAAHHDELAAAGPVNVAVLLSKERRGHHVVVVTVGRRSAEPVVRIQSSCLYGETLGSLECDCGDQLRASLGRMRAAGSGILIYLDQEGRGAGLTVKALAYELAERLDFDTFGAYAQLGIVHDLRTYSDAVRILKLLDVGSCLLLTNNPAKVRALQQANIGVRRQHLWVQKGAHARRIRATRQAHGYLA